MAEIVDALPEPLTGLVRDHRVAEGIVRETRAAVEASFGAPETSDVEIEALSRLYLLRDFLDQELSVHIAKEGQVLFPILRRMLAEGGNLVEDMLAEHELVRDRQRRLRQILTELDDDHAAMSDARASLDRGPEAAAESGLAGVLAALQNTIEQLDWILQGHFTGEEDGLFLPAVELLPAGAFPMLAKQMLEIEAAPRSP